MTALYALLPTGPWVSLLLVLVTTLPCPVAAYSSGAPVSACASMVPGHGASTLLLDQPFPIITVNSYTYSPMQLIRLTLEPRLDAHVRGFMMQARPANDTDADIRIGHFIGDEDSQPVCNHGAITHRASLLRYSASVTWQAPAGPVGDIIFRATVVNTFSDYYTEIYSPVLSFQLPTTPTTTTTTTTTAPTTTTTTTTPSTPILTWENVIYTEFPPTESPPTTTSTTTIPTTPTTPTTTQTAAHGVNDDTAVTTENTPSTGSRESVAPNRPPNLTLPPGFPNLPANFTFPPGMNIPANFTLPPGMKIPANFTLPPGMNIPANFTFPPGMNIPANFTFPPGFPRQVPAGFTFPPGIPKRATRVPSGDTNNNDSQAGPTGGGTSTVVDATTMVVMVLSLVRVTGLWSLTPGMSL